MSDATEYHKGVEGKMTATEAAFKATEILENAEAERAEVVEEEATIEEEVEGAMKELTVLEEPGDESEPEQVINVSKEAVTTVGDGTGPNATVETEPLPNAEILPHFAVEDLGPGSEEVSTETLTGEAVTESPESGTLPVENGTNFLTEDEIVPLSPIAAKEGIELMEGERQEAEAPPLESDWKNRGAVYGGKEPLPDVPPGSDLVVDIRVEEDEVELEPTKIAVISLFHNRKTEVEFESFDDKPWTWKHISMVRASLRRGFAKYNADRKKELKNGG